MSLTIWISVVTFFFRFCFLFFFTTLCFGYVGCIANMGLASIFEGGSLSVYVKHAFNTQYYSAFIASFCLTMVWHIKTKNRAV